MRTVVGRLLCLLTVLAVGFHAGCGGNGGGGGGGIVTPPLTPSFSASGTVARPNLVFLKGAAVNGDLITVDVAIGGPTTSQDIYAFAFHVVIADPAVIEYVTASAGNALAAPVLFVPSLQGDRIVVGITKQNPASGNGVATSEATVVSLTFRVLRPGTSGIRLDGSSGSPPTPPQAVDPTGAQIGSIVFDTASAAIHGT